MNWVLEFMKYYLLAGVVLSALLFLVIQIGTGTLLVKKWSVLILNILLWPLCFPMNIFGCYQIWRDSTEDDV